MSNRSNMFFGKDTESGILAPTLHVDENSRPEYTESPANDVRPSVVAMVLAMGVILALLAYFGLLNNGQGDTVALVTAIVSFLGFTVFSLMIITGTLVRLFSIWVHGKTERKRIQSAENVQRDYIDYLAAPRNPSGPRAPLPVPPTDLYVEQQLVNKDDVPEQALTWARTLYDQQGQPSPKMLFLPTGSNGLARIRVKVVGSNRGVGSEEMLNFLLRNGVLRKVSGGYALDLTQYSTVESLDTLSY